MNGSEQQFISALQKLGKDRAQSETGKPLPWWASVSWKSLLLASLLISVIVCTLSFSFVWQLFQKGVLQWLLQ